MRDASTLRGALASIIADPDCCAASKAIARDAMTYHANSADTEDMSYEQEAWDWLTGMVEATSDEAPSDIAYSAKVNARVDTPLAPTTQGTDGLAQKLTELLAEYETPHDRPRAEVALAIGYWVVSKRSNVLSALRTDRKAVLEEAAKAVECIGTHISYQNAAAKLRALAKEPNPELSAILAQAIEAGTAETGTGSVHESAVSTGDAP